MPLKQKLPKKIIDLPMSTTAWGKKSLTGQWTETQTNMSVDCVNLNVALLSNIFLQNPHVAF